jgi:hypothetical protein
MLRVQPVAGCRLHHLRHQRLRVPDHAIVERSSSIHFRDEGRHAHLKAAAGDLNNGVVDRPLLAEIADAPTTPSLPIVATSAIDTSGIALVSEHAPEAESRRGGLLHPVDTSVPGIERDSRELCLYAFAIG